MGDDHPGVPDGPGQRGGPGSNGASSRGSRRPPCCARRRQARLPGSDAPVRVAASDRTRESVEAMIGEFEQLLASESDG